MSQDPQQNQANQTISNGLRLAGDTLIAPGMSQVLDGNVGAGVGRFLVAVAARAVLGPIGWLAVGLDSYAKSTTGRGLVERVTNRTTVVAAPAQAPAASVIGKP